MFRALNICNPFVKKIRHVLLLQICVFLLEQKKSMQKRVCKKEYVKKGEKYLFSTNHLAGGRISLRQELKWVCVWGGGGLKWGRERGKVKAKGGRNF